MSIRHSEPFYGEESSYITFWILHSVQDDKMQSPSILKIHPIYRSSSFKIVK